MKRTLQLLSLTLALSAPALFAQAPPQGNGAQQPPGGQAGPGGPAGGRRPPPPLVAALDADHDGVISAAEIANASVALKTLDKNGDGQLTQDELRPPRREGGPGGQGGPGGPGGGAGGPPPDGAGGPPKQGANAAGGDQPRRGGGPGGPGGQGGQGQGGPGGGPGNRPPSPLMEALDTNHDGILSAEEIANAPASLKKLDKNGDGQLTADEYRPQGGGRGPGGPGGPGGAGGPGGQGGPGGDQPKANATGKTRPAAE